MHPDDVDRISDQIVAIIPGDHMELEPDSPLELLDVIVREKQQHSCQKESGEFKACRAGGRPCKYHFPQELNFQVLMAPRTHSALAKTPEWAFRSCSRIPRPVTHMCCV